MNLVYYDPYPNAKLEAYIKQYGELLRHNGEPPVYCKRLATVEEVLKEADVSYKTAQQAELYSLTYMNQRVFPLI